MRSFLATLMVGGAILLASGTATAQSAPFVYVPPPVVYAPPPIYPVQPFYPTYQYNYQNFRTPYGIRSSYNYSTTVDPFGTTYYQYGYQTARPYSVGPLHSVYFDRVQNRYVYVPNY